MSSSHSASDFRFFTVVAQNMNLLATNAKHAFACLGNSYVSRTLMTCQLGPGALAQQDDTGGARQLATHVRPAHGCPADRPEQDKGGRK